MILVTRINGSVFALNPDLVERVDCTPDTVVTLVDGTKYIISESVPEFVDSVRHYRASLIAQASRMETELPTTSSSSSATSSSADDEIDAKVLPLHRKER
ncbi:putative flagellar FlbD family protein [Actinoplanes missouriensis 431]|uniref:Putative flagellar FlbD family protein n=1 Tax=Actinoplanes missouriensis (strain ATCC 14538 / DSM 43046 / CBS 188.64 / JCM 3121 / NBRC 102363 / NCIMB 12654 / NRRL B-3342 / UNCC 431) TaxID=512565 RepID=I0HIM8_ACTM4|nr:flagellar FlbD family protein [Actinoplanes missouriensis]BAL92865.1 putative flagellar FlbD family protein [Actinoplanes missouriensis 431]